MKRNRQKLKRRAAAWKASKEDTFEAAVMRLVTGQTLGEFLGKGRGPQKFSIFEGAGERATLPSPSPKVFRDF